MVIDWIGEDRARTVGIPVAGVLPYPTLRIVDPLRDRAGGGSGVRCRA